MSRTGYVFRVFMIFFLKDGCASSEPFTLPPVEAPRSTAGNPPNSYAYERQLVLCRASHGDLSTMHQFVTTKSAATILCTLFVLYLLATRVVYVLVSCKHGMIRVVPQTKRMKSLEGMEDGHPTVAVYGAPKSREGNLLFKGINVHTTAKTIRRTSYIYTLR